MPHLKSGNYLASVAAKQRAETAGAYECLLTAGDPPEVLEGATSNILMWDGSALVSTPSARSACRCDPGGGRGRRSERPASPYARSGYCSIGLRGNSLLLTSSLLGVCFCASLDGHRLLPAGRLAGGCGKRCTSTRPSPGSAGSRRVTSAR